MQTCRWKAFVHAHAGTHAHILPGNTLNINPSIDLRPIDLYCRQRYIHIHTPMIIHTADGYTSICIAECFFIALWHQGKPHWNIPLRSAERFIKNQMQPDFSLISVMAARALACGECPCPHRLVAVKKLSFFQGTLTLTFFICVSLVCPKWSPGYCDMRIAAQRRKVNPRFEGALAPRRNGWKDLDILIASAVYSGSGKVGQICSKFVDSSSLALFEMRWMRSTHWHLSWSFQVPLSQGTRPGRLASKKHELQRVRLDIMQDVFLLWYNSIQFKISDCYWVSQKMLYFSRSLRFQRCDLLYRDTNTIKTCLCTAGSSTQEVNTFHFLFVYWRTVYIICTIMHG